MSDESPPSSSLILYHTEDGRTRIQRRFEDETVWLTQKLMAELKSRVRTAQVKAALSVNAHLVWLYWQMGHRIAQQQAKEGWGSGVIPRLAADLHAEFPELKGFSERNIGRMIRFSGEYPDLFAVLPPLVAKLPWAHHVILMEKVRHANDQPTIGLLLCREKNRLTVEYALRDVKKPVGVAEWRTRLVESLPKQLRGALPSVEDLERGLANDKP